MKLNPTKYAHNFFIMNISYHKKKNYIWARQVDFIGNRKLKRRTYEISRYTMHYNLYHNVDFEVVNAIYKSTDIYYSIFIN